MGPAGNDGRLRAGAAYKLVLIRHGESTANLDESYAGCRLCLPVTEIETAPQRVGAAKREPRPVPNDTRVMQLRSCA